MRPHVTYGITRQNSLLVRMQSLPQRLLTAWLDRAVVENIQAEALPSFRRP
jgi:hypothetical protein